MLPLCETPGPYSYTIKYPGILMATKVLHALILGPPGAGKGTIASRIVKTFRLNHLSSGDLFRAQIGKKTEIGLTAKSYIDKGSLVPDDVTVKLMLSELNSFNNQGWLLDGFPRTVAQAEALAKSEQLDTVIHLDVPFETIIDRIRQRWVHIPSGRIYHETFNPPKTLGKDDITGEPLEQREDDKPASVQKRLESYQLETAPVLEYYKQKKILTTFSGTESNVIWPHVEEHIKNLTS
ncbi:GTP:AMP phosphotransferase AK3, mitochondrial-like [Dysidea avara]|uniref:GTP:AMP phosphotransferase AK3, mitochondrial-like n=1 Tax=Dysidea avara TaxID=196820 RepID=UPI0033174537